MEGEAGFQEEEEAAAAHRPKVVAEEELGQRRRHIVELEHLLLQGQGELQVRHQSEEDLEVRPYQEEVHNRRNQHIQGIRLGFRVPGTAAAAAAAKEEDHRIQKNRNLDHSRYHGLGRDPGHGLHDHARHGFAPEPKVARHQIHETRRHGSRCCEISREQGHQ